MQLTDGILLIISSLSLGGAQRVLTGMANFWAQRGKTVTIATFQSVAEKPLFPLEKTITLLPLGLMSRSGSSVEGLYNNFRRIRIVRNLIRKQKPQVVISFLDTTNVLTLLAARGLDVPVIVTEMSDPAQVPLASLWKLLRLITYRWAQGIGVVTSKARDYFPSALRERIAVIPNPVILEKQPPINPVPFPAPAVIYFGRLAAEKRVELLLQAFALLTTKYPEWRLVIIGDGPMRNLLESLRDELALGDRVVFLGLVESPHSLLPTCSFCVLVLRGSRFPWWRRWPVDCRLSPRNTIPGSGRLSKTGSMGSSFRRKIRRPWFRPWIV